jgi:hypothetical protein
VNAEDILERKGKTAENRGIRSLFSFQRPSGSLVRKGVNRLNHRICDKPIDLIPDFIPILGQIDDIIIVPAGISIIIKMIPKDVMEECRQKVKAEPINTKTKWIVALLIILIWIFAIYLVLRFISPFLF